MARLTVQDQIRLSRALARVQACVDQLQGQDVFLAAMNLIGMSIDPLAARRKVLDLLQGELDVVFRLTGRRSPSELADAEEWMLKVLRP